MEKNWINFNNLPEALFKIFGELAHLKSLILENGASESGDKLMSIEETSVFLHVKKQTLYSYVSKGIIPHSKRAGRLYFSKNDLIVWVKDGNKRSFDVEEEARKIICKKKGGSHE
nr:helix-turn-helix domain-containing protein [Cytophagales bacterium]